MDAGSTVKLKPVGDQIWRPDLGATPLMQTLYGGNDDHSLKIVTFLLTKGAAPNFADAYGETAMMIADRAGFTEAQALLTAAGARPFDPSDPKVKAALVRIDAVLLMPLLDNFVVEHSGYVQRAHAKEALGFEQMGAYCWSPQERAIKPMSNKGLDVCGHPYVCRPFGEVPVAVAQQTIDELSSAVGPDHWEGFVVPK